VCDLYCPLKPSLRFGAGGKLVVDAKPRVPGLFFLSCQMNAGLANTLESIPDVFSLRRNTEGCVAPIDAERLVQIQAMRIEEREAFKHFHPELGRTPEAAIAGCSSLPSNYSKNEDSQDTLPCFKKGCSVRVGQGVFMGRFGVVTGFENGKVVVNLSKNGFSHREVFFLNQIEQVHSPMEGGADLTQHSSLKQLVAAVMRKQPDSYILAAINDAGLLSDILNEG
jgi:transcription antitermination factor NusG